MLEIEKIDHIGIRVRDKQRSIAFYESLGFVLVADAGFADGHPIIMEHASGVVLNLLGPASEPRDENILMDIDKRYAGYTHFALKITSLAAAEAWLSDRGIEITGRFSFKDMRAVFIRDPDRNVIELDEYPGDDPAARLKAGDSVMDAFKDHP